MTDRLREAAGMPLRVRVERCRLILSIGLDTLAYAARHAPEIERAFVWDDAACEYNESRFRVVDKVAFAKAVCAALNDEAEDGSTKLTRLLDECFMDAIEAGAEGVEIPALDGGSR